MMGQGLEVRGMFYINDPKALREKNYIEAVPHYKWTDL